MKHLYKIIASLKGVMHSSVLPGMILFFAFLSEVKAQGDMLVTPRRLILDKTASIKEVNIANAGKDTVTYLVSFREMRMNEDGSFEYISAPDPGQNFASSHLRVFPRRITLAPNEAQTVKIQIVNPELLPAGEYRSHLYLRAEPGSPRAAAGTSQAISVSLVPVFGMTIPVIIRSGNLGSQVQLSDVALTVNNAPKLSITFNRTGSQSVYGDVMVEHISAGGRTVRVATVKGLAVYTPNQIRKVSIDLDRNAGIDYTSGTLRVVYSAQQKQGESLLAEAKIVLR